jgi:hypothetical protein
MTVIIRRLISKTFLACLPASLLSVCYNLRALVDELRMIRTQMVMRNRLQNGHSASDAL